MTFPRSHTATPCHCHDSIVPTGGAKVAGPAQSWMQRSHNYYSCNADEFLDTTGGC